MKKLLIITGGSKGIGLGIVKAYLNNNYHVISISRTLCTKIQSPDFIQVQFDLCENKDVESLIHTVFQDLESSRIMRIVLINNAGTLGEIGPLESISLPNIEKTIYLNTTIPLSLTSLFLKTTSNWKCDRKIISISSGAAVKSYHGWSVYCTSKAAIDMMTRTIALEQSTVKNGANVIAIYPGVVDTEMQNQIRNTDILHFKDINRFIELKESGSLAHIESVGKEIYDIDNDKQYENGSIIDVRNFRNKNGN